MEAWPALLPGVTEEVNQNQLSALARSSIDVAKMAQRKRNDQEYRTLPVMWNMTEFQWAIFQYWFVNLIAQGANTFLIDLPMGNGLVNQAARFTNQGIYTVQHSERRWIVTALLEIYVEAAA